jgi:sialic acid synthase SpsE
MHCILCYPTNNKNANLKSITFLKKKFHKIPIGLSDHTLGILAPVIATSIGSVVTEKHFTIDKNLKKSADHWLSVNEAELNEMIKNIRLTDIMLGKEIKKSFRCELIARKNARRSLVANEKIKKGEPFTEENLTTKRPGIGVSANKYFEYLNRKSKKNYNYDDLI